MQLTRIKTSTGRVLEGTVIDEVGDKVNLLTASGPCPVPKEEIVSRETFRVDARGREIR